MPQATIVLIIHTHTAIKNTAEADVFMWVYINSIFRFSKNDTHYGTRYKLMSHYIGTTL